MAIEFLELLQGTFCLIFIILTIIIGLTIALKYIKYRHKNLILIGIAWIGMAVPWIPEIIELYIRSTDASVNNNVIIFLFIILNLAILPFFVVLWLIAFTDLLNLKKTMRSMILIIFAFFSIIAEILIFYFYYTNLALVGTFSGPHLLGWSLFANIFLFICILFVLISGLLFARESLKSSDIEIKLKGKLLLTAFLLFTVGAIIDVALASVISNVIARSVLAFSSIMFYFGYILPDWIKKLSNIEIKP